MFWRKLHLTEVSRAGDKFCGQWHFDSVHKEWVGNLVWSAEVEDILEACKYKDGESKRTHSKAMSIGNITKLHDYVGCDTGTGNTVVSWSWVKNFFSFKVTFVTELVSTICHMLMVAYISVGISFFSTTTGDHRGPSNGLCAYRE